MWAGSLFACSLVFNYLIVYYPWRCLKRGFFLLITNNFPLRFTILQSTLRFLIEALTFIKMFLAFSFGSNAAPGLFVPENDSSPA